MSDNNKKGLPEKTAHKSIALTHSLLDGTLVWKFNTRLKISKKYFHLTLIDEN